MNQRKGRRVLILTADGFEESELLMPLGRLRELGVEAEIASGKQGTLRGKHGAEVEAMRTVEEVVVPDYAGLILPGGRAPERLREDPAVLALVRAFAAATKPIAAICHGPLLLLAAGVIKGRRATGYQGITDALRAGGVDVRDVPVVVDGQFITSRHPPDLPAFMDAFLMALR